MNLAELSVKRPTFITCVVLIVFAMGLLSLKKLGVDLFPNITLPVVYVATPYPGAGPQEVETLVSKVLEDEISTVSGISTLRSTSKEGISTVIAEFTLETDVKYAEQQIRDRVSSAKQKLPDDIEEPVIRRVDPADQPVLIIAVSADLPDAKLYDFVNETLRPKIEQVNQVGLVEILGGRKREIRIELDRKKLRTHELSVTSIANRIATSGQNIPAGHVDESKTQIAFRTLGDFKDLKDIENTLVNFWGNDVPVKVSQVGRVIDDLEDENSRVFSDGKKSIFIMVFRQSGSNTIAVVDAVKKRVNTLNTEYAKAEGSPELKVVRDGAKPIRANVDDVKESILLGVLLTSLVVLFFLGSVKSTLITGLALPTSIIGSFFLMRSVGFTINVMTLLALSLSVGLVIDDAIVVRENIFRHMKMGKNAILAALVGTKEVAMAVVATTLTVIAVFGPIGFLEGVTGQFFREFGLTICFAMLISIFDAFTMAPMLSAYFAGFVESESKKKNLWDKTIGRAIDAFQNFQTQLEHFYERVIHFTLRHPLMIVVFAVSVFISSIVVVVFLVPKTFLPPQDFGEFSVSLDLPPGTNLEVMTETAHKVDDLIRANKEVANSVMIIGNRDGEPNVTTFYVNLVPSKQRKVNTSEFKERLRGQLKPFIHANPTVKDIDAVAGGERPFNLNIIGPDLPELEKIGTEVLKRLKNHPALKDADISFRPGKPEFQVQIIPDRAQMMGVSTVLIGQELRSQIEGIVPAKFRQGGTEYDIRVRLQEDQRNLRESFQYTFVPNINNTQIRLSDVARPHETTGPANINRQDRIRYVQISSDFSPQGSGLGGVMSDINKMFATDIKLPEGVRYKFVGQAERFQELGQNMALAIGLGVLFIYLILASLYESFIIPFTIMIVLPLAACGAFFALAITRHALDIFSMIGCIMLFGIAMKNSILLVDYANHLVAEGRDRAAAIAEAGKTRLRPILMTTVALIAGMLPIAMGLNEASKQRTSMGIAVIGGLITSTLLSLLVVPAVYSFIDRFRVWALEKARATFVK